MCTQVTKQRKINTIRQNLEAGCSPFLGKPVGNCFTKTADACFFARLYPPLSALHSRLFFVLAGNTTQNYLEYRPDLVNATMFVSEPYKGNPPTPSRPSYWDN